MSWIQSLGRELAVRGVGGGDRERIVLELRDHIDCEPGCDARFGDPAALAATFADELATGKSRRAANGAFAALAVTALALAVSQVTLGRIGYPGFDHGLTQVLFWPGLLGMFVAPQVALVSGTLAGWRALRRRRAVVLPAAEVALIARRTRIALTAGAATVAGMALYALDFAQRLPAWWVGLSGTLALAAGVALLCAWRRLAGTLQLRSSAPGPAGSIFDDLPLLDWRWLRARPWRLGVLGSLLAGAIMVAFEAHAEHSLTEGLQRGTVEGLAAATGFLILGRAIGIAAPRRQLAGEQLTAEALLLPGASSRRMADDDRAHAERLLRDGYARGQISLEELSDRIALIHRARTLHELRSTLADLL